MGVHPSSSKEDTASVVEIASAADKQNATKLFSIGNIIKPLRNRNFLLLFSGQLISNVGDMLYYVALPWFMLSNGGGAQALGIVLAAFGILRVVGVLLGGVLSDRLRPRRAMLLTDSVRIFLMAALALLVMQGHPALWALCLVSALLGLFGGLFLPATMSVVPSILSGEELQAGNSLTTSSAQLAGAAGAGIAGVVVALLQPWGTLVLDALTFVASAVTLFFIQDVLTSQAASASKSNEHTGETGETIAEPLTFWQLLRRSRILQTFIVLFFSVSLGTGAMFEVALPSLLHNQLHASASGYGFLLAGFSIGAIIGSLAAGGLGKVPYRLALSMVGFFIEGLLIMLLPFMGNVGIGVLITLAAGVLNGLGYVIMMSVIQGGLPAHLMGRVMSIFGFASFALYPLSVAIGGVVVPCYGPVPIFLVGGLLLAVSCLVSCLQRAFWQREDVKLM
jgi:predicted MFS family arabinose efflux permease